MSAQVLLPSRTVLSFIVLAVSLSFASACAQQGSVPSSTVVQLKEALSKKGKTKVVVVDVRTAPELTSQLGKLDNILHIPLGDLSSRAKELAAHKADDIYVICRSGNRSVAATQYLREQGYKAFNVQGGMIGWREKYGSANK